MLQEAERFLQLLNFLAKLAQVSSSARTSAIPISYASQAAWLMLPSLSTLLVTETLLSGANELSASTTTV